MCDIMQTKFPFNIAYIILIIFAIIGLYWLDGLELTAGSRYLWLLFIGLFFFMIAITAKFIVGLDFWFEVPINKNEARGILNLGLGVLVLLILVFLSTTTGLSFHSAFAIAPLANFALDIGANTFSALQAATSPFWTVFISVISASVIEETVLGWFFVAIGSLAAGYGLRKLLKIDFGAANKHWDFFAAIIFSIILFSVFHFFNGSYINPDGTWNMGAFGYAAGFRAVLNILIYKFGNMGLLFSIGVHATHNAWLQGIEIVKQALFTWPGGILLMAILAMFVFFMVLSIKEVFKEGELMAKDFVTFD